MIRNLKVLLAAALALAAVGAISASAAQAAEFHCSVEPCRYRATPDGTGSTAHHVFIVENSTTTESVSFTCAQITGEGTSATKTATSVTLENITYPSAGCKVNGSTGVTVVMNGCKYKFTNTGTVTITGCEAGKSIEVKITGCTFTIGEQGPLNGITYHTVNTPREVTVSTDVHPIVVTADGPKASCLINPSQTLIGTYTTGNTIVTGETTGEKMEESWFE